MAGNGRSSMALSFNTAVAIESCKFIGTGKSESHFIDLTFVSSSHHKKK